MPIPLTIFPSPSGLPSIQQPFMTVRLWPTRHNRERWLACARSTARP
jgi:hypothetical protein